MQMAITVTPILFHLKRTVLITQYYFSLTAQNINSFAKLFMFCVVKLK